MPTDSDHWQLRGEVAELRSALNKTIRLLRMTGMAATTSGFICDPELVKWLREQPASSEAATPAVPDQTPGLTRKEVLELLQEVLDMTYSREGDPVYGDDCDALLSAMRTGLNELLQKNEPRS